MEVKVLAFGAVREIVGAGLLVVQLPSSCTAGNLIEQLNEIYPALTKLSSFSISINGVYALPANNIAVGDEVAIIPPVSGG